jgi:PEP-CTERM/exosortase A-associated glycosyltransferase
MSVRVLHVLHSAHPDVTGGSIRSRYLVETQAALGLVPVVVSSPFQPPCDPASARGVEWVNGVAYHRTFDPTYDHRFMVPRKPLGQRVQKLTALFSFTKRIRSIARAERVDVIHGHSLFYCGMAAALAARSLGRASIYEVRSLIEEGLVQEGGARRNGLLFRSYRSLERLSLAMVDHVVAISEGLRTDLIARGIAQERITVVPNGVDVDQQQPAPPRDPSLLAELGWPPGAFVVGYIGSLLAYESLDVLIGAVAALAPRAPALRLLIVGDGPARDDLMARARELSLADRVQFAGRVRHEEVARYYGAVDLFVLPRVPTRLTNLVTPLKPLEIMARAKPLLASDCGGHRELVVPGENGLLYDAAGEDALARSIRDCAGRREQLESLGRRARAWVARRRSWRDVVGPSLSTYARLAERRAAA